MTANTPASRKAKGRRLQQAVRQDLVDRLGIDPGDILSTAMGQSRLRPLPLAGGPRAVPLRRRVQSAGTDRLAGVVATMHPERGSGGARPPPHPEAEPAGAAGRAPVERPPRAAPARSPMAKPRRGAVRGQITMPTYDSEYWRQQRQMATELGEPFAEPFPWAPASMAEAAASLPDDVREKLEALKCAEERVRAQNRRMEEESNPLLARKGWRQPRKRRKQP
jgi:hypothetical protein